MKRSILRAMVFGLAALSVGADASLAHAARPHGPGDAAGGAYYVDFLARPNGIVGHSFVQAGRLDAAGGRHPEITAGLYPANPNQVFDTRGKVTALLVDLKAKTEIRYRVLVSERTYAKTLALMRSLPSRWQHYDVVSHNCNNMMAEVAKHLGIAAPDYTSDLPANYVTAIASANAGRTRASWR